jgi:hypothetical protein
MGAEPVSLTFHSALRSSPLKLLCQMNQNLVGSILGRSTIQNANLVPIRLQTWSPHAILVSHWLICKNRFLNRQSPKRFFVGPVTT